MGNGLREKHIEQALVKEVKKRNGVAYKFVSPGCAGVPDRLVLFPHRRMAFIELKASGQRLRPLQKKRKRQLESLGFLVFCLDDIGQIGGVLDGIQAT